jgi:hypothetical protein
MDESFLQKQFDQTTHSLFSNLKNSLNITLLPLELQDDL